MTYEDDEFERLVSAALGDLADEVTERDLRPADLGLPVTRDAGSGDSVPGDPRPVHATGGRAKGTVRPFRRLSELRSTRFASRVTPALVAAAVAGVLIVGFVAAVGSPSDDTGPSTASQLWSEAPSPTAGRSGHEQPGAGASSAPGAPDGVPPGGPQTGDPGADGSTPGALPGATGSSTGTPQGDSAGGSAGATGDPTPTKTTQRPATGSGKPSGRPTGTSGAASASGTPSATATTGGPSEDRAECRDKTTASASGLPTVFQPGVPVEFTVRWTYTGTGTCEIPDVDVAIRQSTFTLVDVDCRMRSANGAWQNALTSQGTGGPNGVVGVGWTLAAGETRTATVRVAFTERAPAGSATFEMVGRSRDSDTNGSLVFTGTVAGS